MTEYYSWIMLIPLVFLIPPLPFFRRYLGSFPAQKLAYGAATSGILLTFYGIWIGLTGFDVNDIEKSIPVLLEGLKTSFGSSIVGLTCSMLINLFFVKQEKTDEQSLIEVVESLKSLERSIGDFADQTTATQTETLTEAIRKLLEEIEMSVNNETKETISTFRDSVEYLREWQEKYVDEIKAVTEAMDKNATVTNATTQQLDRTNDVLDQLGPVTEKIADSIGWVQKALPATRKRGFEAKDEK
tara:strand:- start:978 stop:1706 length:729 start_codon:yes stop_codon:yes gene_type:complete